MAATKHVACLVSSREPVSSAPLFILACFGDLAHQTIDQGVHVTTVIFLHSIVT